MRKLFFVLCLFYCVKGWALDAGYAYRFYVDFTLKTGEKQNGYIYKYSYNEFKIAETNFIEFLREYSKEIIIYPHVISINAGRNNVDFALEGTKQKISLDTIENIELIDFLNFIVGERIKELSKEQYQLIKTKKAKYAVIEDVNIYENLQFILFTWDENKEISIRKNSIAKEIKEKWKRFIEIDISQSEKFNVFMKTLKENLLKENILLIQFAEAL